MLSSSDHGGGFAGLPERVNLRFPRHGQLERLYRAIKCGDLCLTDEQLNVLRQDDASDDNEVVSLTDALQGRFEEAQGDCTAEMALAVIATEGDEVEVPGLLETAEPLRHRAQIRVWRVFWPVSGLTLLGSALVLRNANLLPDSQKRDPGHPILCWAR